MNDVENSKMARKNKNVHETELGTKVYSCTSYQPYTPGYLRKQIPISEKQCAFDK